MSFLRVLPDPNYLILDSGIESSEGVAGPGFKAVDVGFNFKVERNDSIGGRSNLKTKQRPYWSFTLKYNPLLDVEFQPVYNFLMQKRGSKESFYVSLPQYQHPKDSTFATWVASNTPITDAAMTPGATFVTLDHIAWSANDYSVSGLPTVGDIFNVEDATDSTHSQVYMITRVEYYPSTYETAPGPGNIRIHFTPPMARTVPVGTNIQFNNPLFRVKQRGDIQQYSLDTENLYEFSVQVEEAG